jgi:hypothetical protein
VTFSRDNSRYALSLSKAASEKFQSRCNNYPPSHDTLSAERPKSDLPAARPLDRTREFNDALTILVAWFNEAALG